MALNTFSNGLRLVCLPKKEKKLQQVKDVEEEIVEMEEMDIFATKEKDDYEI